MVQWPWLIIGSGDWFVDHSQHFRMVFPITLQWRSNERDGVWNHQPHDCLFNRWFRHRWKKTSKLPVTGLREGNSQVTCEFPTQRASNAENVLIWWRHHEILITAFCLDVLWIPSGFVCLIYKKTLVTLRHCDCGNAGIYQLPVKQLSRIWVNICPSRI